VGIFTRVLEAKTESERAEGGFGGIIESTHFFVLNS